MLNKGLAREVKEFQVYCPNTSEGCDWVGEVGKVETHLSPGVSEHSARLCQFEKIACSNDGCEEEVYRRDLDVHQTTHCPYRITECRYCKSYRSTYNDITTNHFFDCPAYPVDCPNGCGEPNLRRSKLQEHFDTCPCLVVNCDFKAIGCAIHRSRATMAAHLDMNTNFHMRLLCKVVCENRAKLEAVGELERQVATLHEENKKVRKENLDLTNLTNQLKSSVTSMQKQVERFNEELQTVKGREEELREKLKEQASAVEAAEKARTTLEEELTKLKEEVNQKSDLREVKEQIESQKATVIALQGDVAHCRETVDSQDTKIKSMKKSVEEEIEERENIVKVEINKATTVLQQAIQGVSDELDVAVEAQKDQLKKVNDNLKYVEMSVTPRPPFAFTVSRFQERKSHKEAFVSPPFYHDLRGYKMCVRVDVYGMNNHVAVFCCIMRGEHDEHLEWPFFGAVKVRLQNHLDDHNHFEKDICYDRRTDEKKSGRVKTGDKNYLHGHPQFISHSKLAFDAEKNCQYLKGDALDFEVIGVELLPRN